MFHAGETGRLKWFALALMGLGKRFLAGLHDLTCFLVLQEVHMFSFGGEKC